MTEQLDLKAFLDALATRTRAFFAEELGIAVKEPLYHFDDVQKLDLRHLTAILSATGQLKLYLTAVLRLLVAKRVVSKEELEALVVAIDGEDGTVDGERS